MNLTTDFNRCTTKKKTSQPPFQPHQHTRQILGLRLVIWRFQTWVQTFCQDVQCDHSTRSSMADWYCVQNMDNSYIQALCVFLEFPKEFPMGKIFVQNSILGDCGKFGHDPASRLANCSQVIKVYNIYWKSLEFIKENVFNVWFWKIYLKSLYIQGLWFSVWKCS